MRSSMVVAALACLCMVSLAVPAARANDEPDELVPGRIVIIKDGKLAKFVAKPPTGTTFDLPDATNDPTSEGGQLDIFDDDPFRPVSDSYALPAGGWKALGNPAGSKGYKYTGAGSPSDPCRVVLVKEKVVKAVCKGTGVSLPTPFTGQVGIVLTVGTDSKRYCALFGGDEVKNDATLLKRKSAPAPGSCPLDLNSSTTFVTTSTSTSISSSTSTSSSTTSTSTSVTTTHSGTITTTSTSSSSTTSTTMNTQCVSCADCNNQACIGGVCGACITDSDCCAPLACLSGECVLF